MWLLPRSDSSASVKNALRLVLTASLWTLSLGTLSLGVAMPFCFAQEKQPGAKEASPSAPETSGEASKQLLAEFRQTYALPDGKVIKRVAPPFSPGRLEFYRVHEANQAQIIPEGPEYFWLNWDEPKPTDPRHTGWWSEGRINIAGLGWVGGKGLEVESLVDMFTDIERYEMLGDEKLMDAKVAGDWVIRYRSSPEQVLPELEAILRSECKLPVRLRLVQEDRTVVVAEGMYAYKPEPGKGTVNYKEGTEEGNWLEGNYDVLAVYARDQKDSWESPPSYDLDALLKRLSRSLGRPVLNEVTRPPKNELIVEDNLVRNGAARSAPKEKWDEARLLKRLAEQTGLTFTEKSRRVRVLRVERAD